MIEINPSTFLPHGEDMCLIKSVEKWDKKNITCIANSHRNANNPLRESEGLRSCILNEYAAQAAAIHAGLNNTALGHSKPAYVGAIKNFESKLAFIHDLYDDLKIEAKTEFSQVSGAIYDFIVSHRNDVVASGRLVLVQPQ